MDNGTIIGYAIADAAFTYNPPKEFAGAEERVEVPAGRYPIRVTRYYGAPHYSIALSGVSVYRGWFGSNVRIDTVPEPWTGHESVRGYELAYAILDNKTRGGLRFELESTCYEARRIDFEYDGAARQTAGIFRNGDEIR